MRSSLALILPLVSYGLAWTIPERNHGAGQGVINAPDGENAAAEGSREVQDVFKGLERGFEERLSELLGAVKGSTRASGNHHMAFTFFDPAAFLGHRTGKKHDHDHDHDGNHGHHNHHDHDHHHHDHHHDHDHHHTDPHHRHHGGGHWGGGAPDDNDPYDGTDPGDGPPFHRSPKTPPHHTPDPGHHFPHPERPPMPPSDPHSPHSDSSIMDLLHACPETSRFHDFIKKDKEIYDYLNDRKSNVTVFAPTNKAFELLDRCSKGHDIPPELLKRVLLYHMVEGTHGSQDLRYHNTIATKLSEDKLGGGHHQRLRIGLSHDGPTLNFYAVFKMFDSFVDNGVVHAIDSILLPPPSVIDILQYLPTEFSTTETAFHRTGLLHELSKKSLTDDDDNGTPFTLFAPSNRDWQKLGFAANAFLFSDWGLPYLKAIMKYHIVPGELLYSDAWIKGRHHHHSNGPNTAYDDRGDSSGNRGHNSDILNPVVPEEMLKGWGELRKRDERDDAHGLLHGYSHVQLPTLLKERTLSVDVTRLERFLSFRVNGLTSVVISDAPARNGVLQVPDHVLIPPHSLEEHHDPPEMAEEEVEAWKRGEMPVTLLKAILEPWVEE